MVNVRMLRTEQKDYLPSQSDYAANLCLESPSLSHLKGYGLQKEGYVSKEDPGW
jgi:hypothetical protein